MPPFPAECVLVFLMRARDLQPLIRVQMGQQVLLEMAAVFVRIVLRVLVGWRSYPDALTVATLISASHGGLEHLGPILVDTGKTPQSCVGWTGGLSWDSGYDISTGLGMTHFPVQSREWNCSVATTSMASEC